MAEAGERPTVLITGVSGYLASLTTQFFLEDGGFRVKGTVRDKSNEAKVAPLCEAFGDRFNDIELVEADLLDDDSMVRACRGVDYVVHMASPFFMGDDPEQLITPAINGTLSALKGCQAAGVKRCVVTSSCCSVLHPTPQTDVYDESSWSDPEHPEISTYCKSKVLAEKAAWDFVEALPEGEKFELVTVLPGLVMGPSLKTEMSSTSMQMCVGMLTGKMSPIPRLNLPFVDTREVAWAHLQAVKVAAAANRRFILARDIHWFKAMADGMRAAMSAKGWPVSTEEAPSTPEDPPMLAINNAASSEVLGIEYKSVEQTMTDMAEWVEAKNLVQKPESQ